MFGKFAEKRQEKKGAKSEKLRAKNVKLRQEGKEPLKGWGEMINTGFGGMNNQMNDIDNKAFWMEEQKNKHKEE